MPDWPPRISLDGLPAEEHAILQNMGEQFLGLATFANDFRAALTLFDFCQQQLETPANKRAGDFPFGHWQLAAARDGAMSIYHFGIIIEAIRKQIGKCRVTFPKLDSKKFGALGDHLRHEFRYFEAVRHATAHLAELGETPEDSEKYAVRGPYTFAGVTFEFGSRVTWRNVLVGRQYANSRDGKIEAYEVSQRTYDALVAIRRECYEAFAPVDELVAFERRLITP